MRALGLALLVLVAACVHDREYTRAELTTWYEDFAQDSSAHSPLYYYGSDTLYHYFRCRAGEGWFRPRVSRSALELADVRPLLRSSNGPFPGYYAVDPMRDYAQVAVPSVEG